MALKRLNAEFKKMMAETSKYEADKTNPNNTNNTEPEKNKCGNCGAENHYKSAHFCYHYGYPFTAN